MNVIDAIYYKSDYQKALEVLASKRCPVCGGLGTCNDAEAGDIGYNTWVCKKCNGKGMIDETAVCDRCGE